MSEACYFPLVLWAVASFWVGALWCVLEGRVILQAFALAAILCGLLIWGGLILWFAFECSHA